jgi:pyruvate ferredoxin oxidoreductase beta subunit
MWILFEHINGEFRFSGVSKSIARGKRKMRNLEEYLTLQERFSHISDLELSEIKRYVQERWSRLVKLEGEKDAVVAKFYV